MATTKRIDFLPRGLSRTQAAVYVGVSTSLFDQMVGDGRMPPPREINSRRVWDRHQVDASFDELPGGVDQVSHPRKRRLGMGAMWDAAHSEVSEEDLHETYMQALGYDPRRMTEEERASAEATRIQKWREDVLRSPLWKRERQTLIKLLGAGDDWVADMHIIGASGDTFERLAVRGFVVSKKAPWRYAATGKPAPRDTTHWKLTLEGKAAALGLAK